MLALLAIRLSPPGFSLLSVPPEPDDETLLIMLMNLMLTFAGKREGFESVTILFPGHPLPPEEWGSLHPYCIQQQAWFRPPSPQGLFLQASAQETWTWDALLPFLTTFERVQGRHLPWWGWTGYDVTHTTPGCSSWSQLGWVCICRWHFSSVLRYRFYFQTR